VCVCVRACARAYVRVHMRTGEPVVSMTVDLQQELLEVNKKSLNGHTSGERQCNKSLAACTFTEMSLLHFSSSLGQTSMLVKAVSVAV